MCGIVGILGREKAAPLVVEALKRLEYRGYDSAGVATLEDGHITRLRAEGKLRNLAAKLESHPLNGTIAIGHTRWATHGKPTENNAHPHATDKLAVVHNGIIENFRELRKMMEGEGIVFKTETDTEVVAQLVTRELATTNDPRTAVARALPQLRGAFALAFIFEGEPDLMIGARQGAPLAVGHGDGEMYLGSDALALAPFTDTITYLDDGDWVILNRAEAEYRDAANSKVSRKQQKTTAGAFLVDKGNHRHFMAKEIHEQPEVVGRTLAHYLDMARAEVALPFAIPFAWKDLSRLTISACGTAYLAGYIAKYWFERYARLPVEIDVASEFRYREAPLPENGLAIFISQSGETADTLAALRYAKESGQNILSVVNVTTSTIARESDIVAPILSGPEIGVASTKAFTCQLAVLACLAIAAGVDRGTLSRNEAARLVNELILTPGRISEALHREPAIRDIAQRLTKATDVLYIGRGPAYPLAQEGALKLKEISYIHAEAYAAGELKHGPIALIDEKIPVIVIAPHDPLYEKTISNMQEVAARGGKIILIAEDQAAEQSGLDGIAHVAMPAMASDFAAIPYAVPVQLLAYWTAFLLGKDVDQPRNLAKSVTVE
jgi:glucosamine--fructose-6-phosphate aminotransferase (isomerizing)